MIKVTIADVVKMGGVGTLNYVLVLQDEAGKRALPIWVGEHDGTSIAMGLADFAPIRPLTFSLITDIFQSITVKVEQVRIEALKESIFYAVIRTISGKKVSEIDARPSDAINLAVRTGSPIFVSEEVMTIAGVGIPTTHRVSVERQGVEDIIREMEEKKRIFQEELKNYPNTPGEIEKANNKVVAVVFGG